MPPAHYHTMTNAISVCIESSERTADFSLSRVALSHDSSLILYTALYLYLKPVRYLQFTV